MSKRQKQHLGRSEGDDTMLDGRDIRADTPDGIGSERVDGAFEGRAEDAEDAARIDEAIEKSRKKSGEGDH